MSLTMHSIYDIALEFCPRVASFVHDHPRHWNTWMPAHEIGHFLVEPKCRRAIKMYGRCSLGFCRCRGEACNVAEMAAMVVSSRLLSAARRNDLIDKEWRATADLDHVTQKNYNDARALLRRKGLGRIPRSVHALRAACERMT